MISCAGAGSMTISEGRSGQVPGPIRPWLKASREVFRFTASCNNVSERAGVRKFSSSHALVLSRLSLTRAVSAPFNTFRTAVRNSLRRRAVIVPGSSLRILITSVLENENLPIRKLSAAHCSGFSAQ
jgi:hypothetical protein